MGSGSNFAVYGDIGGLNQLSADQQAHMGRFAAIMNQIHEQSEKTAGQWGGAGSAQFQTKSQEFDSHFAEVNSAFARLIDATDSTSENYQKLSRYLDGLF